MDLSKAFDTLDHNILLKKLRYYGIEGTSLKWFTSYLNQRSQYVELNGSQSDRKIILTGVPQGSILGPLLFLMYMNDIPLTTDHFSYVMYADDTTLLTAISYSYQTTITEQNHTINTEFLTTLVFIES